MTNKKKKNAKKKQKKRALKRKETEKALVRQVSKPRWAGWMRKATYEEDLKDVFTKEALGRIQARVIVEEIILENTGTDSFVRMELSTPDYHVNALKNFVQKNYFRLYHYGNGRFVDLEIRQNCPTICNFSRENLFLVGFLTEEEYKAFQEIRTDESVLKSATEIAGYAFTREDRTLVEVYADSNWSAQREVISRELASTTFQKAVFSPS